MNYVYYLNDRATTAKVFVNTLNDLAATLRHAEGALIDLGPKPSPDAVPFVKVWEYNHVIMYWYVPDVRQVA